MVTMKDWPLEGGVWSPPRRALERDRADSLEDWPGGLDPVQVGVRLVKNFIARRLSFEDGAPLHYAEACAWYGALAVSKALADRRLSARLVQKFEPLLEPGNTGMPARAHVDDRVCGIAPLEMAQGPGDRRHLELGVRLADAQWSTEDGGITTEARYSVDDMYMITSLQVQAFRATGDARYLDRAARTMVSYLRRLQQPSGLFFHTPDSRVYWGRGNGWAAAGMTELLRALPSSHPERPAVLAGYARMMAAVLSCQDEQGLFHQILDDENAWPELSSSAMFTFALVTGVKRGWLVAPAYAKAARKSWLGAFTYLDSAANVRDVCIGTGAAESVVGPSREAQRTYYLDRPRVAGDMHGQAPLLWSAAALLAAESPLTDRP